MAKKKLDVNLSIRGIQEALEENIRMVNELKPSGALGDAIKFITVEAHRYLVSITHVDTGALRASQRMKLEEKGGDFQGRLYIDPKSVNPRTGEKPSEYGEYEEERGGSHASYQRTRAFISSRGMLRRGTNQIRKDLR